MVSTILLWGANYIRTIACVEDISDVSCICLKPTRRPVVVYFQSLSVGVTNSGMYSVLYLRIFGSSFFSAVVSASCVLKMGTRRECWRTIILSARWADILNQSLKTVPIKTGTARFQITPNVKVVKELPMKKCMVIVLDLCSVMSGAYLISACRVGAYRRANWVQKSGPNEVKTRIIVQGTYIGAHKQWSNSDGYGKLVVIGLE